MLYVLEPQALSADTLAAVRDGCRASAFVGDSPLTGGFRGSYGFGAAFTRAGVAPLRERIGWLAPFLDLALRRGAWRSVASLGPLLRLREPNAFYLNALLVPPGPGVSRHVDATLDRALNGARVLPTAVTVLYLEVPGSGGGLKLWRGERSVVTITPEPGLLVRFRGSLAHEVLAVEGEGGLRVSLVCEQYQLAPWLLRRVPRLRLQSKRGFAAYLENAAAKQFELE